MIKELKRLGEYKSMLEGMDADFLSSAVKGYAVGKVNRLIGAGCDSIAGMLGDAIGSRYGEGARGWFEQNYIDRVVLGVLNGETFGTRVKRSSRRQLKENLGMFEGDDVYILDGLEGPENSYVKAHEIGERMYVGLKGKERLSDEEHGRFEAMLLDSLNRYSPEVYRAAMRIHSKRPNGDVFRKEVGKHFPEFEREILTYKEAA